MNSDKIADQIREGRQLLGWSRDRLAAMAEVSRNSVGRLEHDDLNVPLITIATMLAALEAAGVVFVKENGGGPGARLRKAVQ